MPYKAQHPPSNSNTRDRAVAMAVGGNGNVFIAGKSVGSDGKSDIATLAYSNTGLPLRTNRIDGGYGADEASAIAVDRGGNVFVTGSSLTGMNSDCVTIKDAVTGPLLTFSRTGPNTLSLLAHFEQRFEPAADNRGGGGAWTTPPEPVADNGTTKSVSVDARGGTRFFRLSD